MLGTCRVCRRQINFIDNRQNFQIIFQCQIGIGQSLGFNALGSIHNQNSTLTGCQRTGYFIIKVHMTRGINQIHLIGIAILCIIIHTDSTCLDGNTPFTFQLHIVQQLTFHFTLCNRMTAFQQTVCQCGFAMVNMCDNRKVSDKGLIFHDFSFTPSKTTADIDKYTGPETAPIRIYQYTIAG